MCKRKLTKIIMSSAIAVCAVVGAAFANPIFVHKFTADPQPFVWRDRLYVYASYDNNNPTTEGYDIRYYTLMSTEDMKNWTDHGEVFSVKRDMSWANNCYAPGTAVRGDSIFLYVPDGGSSIGVVTANNPAGPFRDPNNGRLVNHNSCTNCSVPWLFDPAGFIDSDGQGYLYFGGGPADDNPGPGQNLRAIRLNSNMTSINGNASTISGAERSFEAAYMHKRGNNYYLSYVQNFSGDGADIAYMMGTSPMPPFTYKGKVLRNGATIGYGNNHAAFVEYKNNWYAFYHDRRAKPMNGNPSGERRSVSVDKLEYNTDGSMKEVVLTSTGPDQLKNFDPYKKIWATTMHKQSGSTGTSPNTNMLRTALCSAPNPGTVANQQTGGTAAGSAGDTCVMLVSIADGKWVSLKNVDFGSGAEQVTVNAASNGSGGSIEFRAGSQTGTLLGTCAITGTSGWNNWREFDCAINKSASAGVKDLFLVFKGSGEPFRLQWYKFSEGAVEPCATAPSATPGNLVADGIFANAIGSDWVLANVTDGAEASASVRCNKATISITSIGDEDYKPQIIQNGIKLEQGKAYTLSFMASAAGNRSIVAQLERLGGDNVDWGYKYGQRTFNITTTEQPYSFSFDMNDPTDETVQLAFNFGAGTTGSTNDVTISNVVLVASGTSQVGSRHLSVSPNGLSVSIKGKTLAVSSPNNSEMNIRVIDVKGKVRANFNATGSANFSLQKIPAGRYFVEVKGVGGVKQTVPVVVR